MKRSWWIPILFLSLGFNCGLLFLLWSPPCGHRSGVKVDSLAHVVAAGLRYLTAV